MSTIERNKRFGINPVRYIYALYMPFFLKSLWTHEIDIPLVGRGGRGSESVLTISDPFIPVISIPIFLYGLYYIGKALMENWKLVNGLEAKMGAYMCIPFGVASFILATLEKPNFAIFGCVAVGVLGLFAIDFNVKDET